ncbi:MAG: hypothetical protein K5639_02405 [Eubacterium sp.]|nr:hypothetical protein [Eubacterium sp.]
MKFFGKTTLIKKLLAFYLVIVMGSFYFMLVFGRSYIYDQVQEETKNAMITAGKQIISSYFDRPDYTSESIAKMRDELSMTGDNYGNRILVIHNDGDIVLDTGKKNVPSTPYNVRNHHESDFLRNEYTYDYTIGGYLSSPSLCVSLPLLKSTQFLGHLIIVQGNEYITEKTDFYYGVLSKVYYILLALLLLTYIGLYFFCFVPLKKLREGCKDFAIGRDNPPILINSHDEYGELAETLNILGNELSKFDEYQRKFLSSISHDFRSPLTSIRGYLQAIQDGVIAPEDQDKIINIILSETDRLTKLTNEIVGLNSFDRDNIFLEISEFDIHKLIREVTDAVSGLAGKKHVKISTTFQPGTPVIVMADRERINQVLYNLLENAVKFSIDGGKINVRTLLRKDTILISIKDNGIGIPKKDLGKIFDRFYKSDLSRGRDKSGSGLGLSICREILKAHKQDIDVVSTEGAGTTFSFSLQTK